MRKIGAAFALLAALCAQPAAARQQLDRAADPEALNGTLGLSLQLGQATGQFANYVKTGFGGGGYLNYRPGRNLPLGIRLTVMYLVYGSQTHRYPLVPGIAVDVTTRNEIAQVSLGPQVTLGKGPLQVYGFAGFGGSFFSTRSGVEGSDQNNQPFASTTNFHDGTFSGAYGGGVLIRVHRSGSARSVYVDLGVHYLNNGRVTYVTKERVSIVNNQLVVDPVDSEANLLVYHLGVAIGR